MLLVVDGDNAAHRFRHTYGDLHTSTGAATGVLYGMIQHIVHLVEEFNPTQVIVAWDDPRGSWRKNLYSGYKRARAERVDAMDEDERAAWWEFKRAQVPKMRAVLTMCSIPQMAVRGLEADDLCAYLTREGTMPGRLFKDALVVSTDSDLVQLVRDGVRVYNPTTRAMYYRAVNKATGEFAIMAAGARKMEQEVAPTPLTYVLRRALCGDKSDSIPGVRGIGAVRARQIVNFPVERWWPAHVRGGDSTSLCEVLGDRARDRDGLKLGEAARSAVLEFTQRGSALRAGLIGSACESARALSALDVTIILTYLRDGRGVAGGVVPSAVRGVGGCRAQFILDVCAAPERVRRFGVLSRAPMDAHHAALHPFTVFFRRLEFEWAEYPVSVSRVYDAIVAAGGPVLRGDLRKLSSRKALMGI